MSRLDLKISEIYGVSLSDTGSMRSSEAAWSCCCDYPLLPTHPHSDPTALAPATNEQVKHSVQLGISGLALFMVEQREKKVVNSVYAQCVNLYMLAPCPKDNKLSR